LEKTSLFRFIGGVTVGIGITLAVAQTGLLGAFRGQGIEADLGAENFSFAQFPTIWLREIVEARDKEERMNALLDRLMTCESGGRHDIVIVDTNGKKSYGHFQFQESTWIELIGRYGLLPNAEPNEYMNFIMDASLQRTVTRLALEDGESWRWSNCVKKIGEPPR